MLWKGFVGFRSNYDIAKINRAICNATLCFGDWVTNHSDIKAIKLNAFSPDGVHLTPLGNEHWLCDVKQGLENWLGDF